MRHTVKIVIFLFVLFASAACTERNKAVFSYHSTPVEGWEQHRTQIFPVDSVAKAGLYEVLVGVRTTYEFPYQTLWLEVTEKLDSPAYLNVDTLVCHITDAKGNTLGNGISLFQEQNMLNEMRLSVGQKGTIAVRHIMRRNNLPGVSDVGVLVRRKAD